MGSVDRAQHGPAVRYLLMPAEREIVLVDLQRLDLDRPWSKTRV
jgi:hypothetical protein